MIYKHICGTIHRTLKCKTRFLKETKLKFRKTMTLPVVLYGSETWVQKLYTTAEITFLRTVKAYTLVDGISNANMRREYKVNWCNHLELSLIHI